MPHVPRKFNLDDYQIESGRIRKENGYVVNEADRMDTVIGQYKSYILPVTTAGVLVEDPSTMEPLAGRHSVYVVNDSSAVVFANMDTVPVVGFSSLTIFSGEAILYNIDPHAPREIFVRTEAFDTTVRVIEVGAEME